MKRAVKNNVYWVGKIDWELESFHGDDYSINNASSQNAYLIQEEKTVLIDTVWKPHSTEFVDNLASEIDLNKIDFIVMNHGECDHSGALPACDSSTIFPTFEEAMGILDLAVIRNEIYKGFTNQETRSLREYLVKLMTRVIGDELGEPWQPEELNDLNEPDEFNKPNDPNKSEEPNEPSESQKTQKLNKSQKPNEPKLIKDHHKQLVHNLMMKDKLRETVFVSTNYDILIDNALALHSEEFDLDYGIDFVNVTDRNTDINTDKYTGKKRLQPEQSVKLYKFHGSLNWLYCPACNTIELTPFEEAAARSTICHLCGSEFSTLITVRDQASKDCLVKIGVQIPPIVVTADPIFALNPAEFDKEEGLSLLNQLREVSLKPNDQPIELSAQLNDESPNNSSNDNTHPTIHLSEQSHERDEGDRDPVEDTPESKEVQPLLGMVLQELEEGQEYKSTIAATADQLVRDGWEVLLLPFRYPTDLQVCQEVSWIMQEPNIHLKERLSLMELFSLLSQVDLLLGMQFPILNMGSVMRKPSIGILQNDKTDRAAKYLEITGQPQAVKFEELEADQLYQLIISTSERKKELISHMDQVLIHLRQASWESAGLTLSYLYSRSPQKRYNNTSRVTGLDQSGGRFR
jgi:polysaccharide pyruvyl transferase WcaK-like protein